MFPFLGGILDATPPETVSLSGTEGAPVSRTGNPFAESGSVSIELAISAIDAGSNLSRGYIEWDSYAGGGPVSYIPIQAWVSPLDFQNGPYYLRTTLVSGNTPNDTPDIGSADGTTWRSLANGSTSYLWVWTTTSQVTYKGATLKFEIATDALGSNIVATGYYAAKVKRTL